MKKQELIQKSQITPLFPKLCNNYSGLRKVDLGFPDLDIAKARIWRNWELPEEGLLEEAINQFEPKGISREEMGTLIALCEALFRPMRAVELELEKIVPHWISNRAPLGWPNEEAEKILLENDLMELWRAKEKQFGNSWILAAGSVPIPIKHRPMLIAPWVVGVVTKRWQVWKEEAEEPAEVLAVHLATVLRKQETRVEDLRYWEKIMGRVQVPNEEGRQILLSSYLMAPWKRLNPCDSEVGWGSTVGSLWSPAQYLKNFPLDLSACQQFANCIKRPWKPGDKDHSKSTSKNGRPKPNKLEEVITEAKNDDLPYLDPANCKLCKKDVPWPDIYSHLKMEHSLTRGQVEADSERREIRITYTKEILFKWSN